MKRNKDIDLQNYLIKYVSKPLVGIEKIVNPRNPFMKDPQFDYDLDSEDEWQELNFDDLENDELRLEDEDEEEDNSELGSKPDNQIQRLYDRSNFCMKTKFREDDDEELKEEGFIVADDNVGDDSDNSDSIIDPNDRKERKKLIERNLIHNHQAKIGGPIYIYQSKQMISKFKAVSFTGQSGFISSKSQGIFPIQLVSKKSSLKSKCAGIVDKIE